MAVPDFQTLLLPLLRIAGGGEEHTLAKAVEQLGNEFRLSDADMAEPLRSGQTKFYNRVGWARTYLVKAGLLRPVGTGRFQVTERGQNLLANCPPLLDVAYLRDHFPEIAAFRKERIDEDPPSTFDFGDHSWNQRPGVAERIEEKLHAAIPDEGARFAALDFLGWAVETADEYRRDGWFLRETDYGLRLMAGRLLAFEIRRSKLRVSVIGPIDAEVLSDLVAEVDDEFKWVPGGAVLSIPLDHATAARTALKNGVESFLDGAMTRVRRSVSLEDHAPEAIKCLSSILGRELPQPEPKPDQTATDLDDDSDDADVTTARKPRVRGRAPIFETGQRSIASLASDIERGVIALPDLQRPFVWEDTKVRDLLDSLFIGFPVGTLVLWHPSGDTEVRALGATRPDLGATTLVIDGQQRLTSLYAVMKGEEVVGKDCDVRRIAIAFRPRDGRFEVADAAIRKDPEFLPNITVLWQTTSSKPQIRRDLMAALREKGRMIDESYEDAVERNLDRAHAIADYRFPTVEIRRTAAKQEEEATEEDVAEIFVRINNQGARLGQADFVLTLLSVYHGELRDLLEERARELSQGSVVGLDTQQLLRAACAVAFGRARMSAVYRFLRGVDPVTGEADPEKRLQLLNELDAAARICIEPTPWRDYLLCVKHAGFLNESLIASKNAIVNAYAFYTRGRKQSVQKSKLDSLIARWIFGSLLTARYSTASETAFEQDLSRLSRVDQNDDNGFVHELDKALSEILTDDYWSLSLVSALETQKARAPAALAFRAAQVVLGARVLFSDQLLHNLIVPPAIGGRAAREAHHLFPVRWLRSHGIEDLRQINQVANLADVGWHENNVIGGQSPATYVPRLRNELRIDDERWGRMCAEHALPPSWEQMEYNEFLGERRRRMADIIRVAFRQLGGEVDAAPLTPPWFVPGAELVWKRIEDTERALRTLVREVYTARFGGAAATEIEASIPEREREMLKRSIRARPQGSDPLSIVDYLYLAQLPSLLFSFGVWQEVRSRLAKVDDLKRRLQTAVDLIAPVRNEIAHVREVSQARLLRATVACNDVIEMLAVRSVSEPSTSATTH
ncbi:DUF262 domain-containing protein [Methylocystis sp. L43]|uniref:GmrSD restriction endonuclease domain-containing protein n=1 Tax=unclassified Methylocystis TaxID=2625913 RepID=UPI0018C2A477|nr:MULTISPECIES: DUF262 domain-containing protein [unclassified Methylocystis]MBG0799529.1 DUF262 domain-containing protein [Methylocystis sp. L43]MBG0807312.1 DUF262 domain-containing protein [Methylocystis sp. H15]